MIRAPLWLIGLLIVAAIAVGVYAYLTTPLPMGLSAVIRTPGGANAAATPLASGSAGGAAARAAAGQPLTLGAASVIVRGVQRNQNLTSADAGAPPGVFTVLDVQLQNAGGEPLTPAASDFRLMDDQGRSYAVDAEATRAVNASGHRRNLFDASVPPGVAVDTFLVFETSASATAATLRVSLGYGDLALPS